MNQTSFDNEQRVFRRQLGLDPAPSTAQDSTQRPAAPLIPTAEERDRAAKRIEVTSWFAIGTLLATAAFWAMELLVAAQGLDSIDAATLEAITTIEEMWSIGFLTTIAAFITWSFRAHVNLHVLGRQGIHHDNQATIWWWIVPFASLVMPFRVIYETARGTWADLRDPEWRQAKIPAVAIWWTVLFLAGIVMSTVSAQMLNGSYSLSALEDALVFHSVASGVQVASAISAIILVLQATQRQALGLRTLAALQAQEVPTRPDTSTQPEPKPDRHEDSDNFCASCGHRYASGEKFCPSCGRART